MNLLFTSLLTWILFIPVAITNGIIRERTYKSIVGDLPAHQISTVIAVAAWVILAYFMLRNKIVNVENFSLFLIGLMWVVMTILFEFGFGHYVDGASVEKLLADYNLFKGHVWGLFLFSILISPFIVKLIKQ